VAETPPLIAEVTLRIVEGTPEAAGKGIVYIDPLACQALGLVPGDVVRITGKKSTVARAVPLPPELVGTDLIQADGVVRGNAGIGLEERVKIARVPARKALTVVLSPVDVSRGFRRPDDMDLLKRSMVGLAMIAGDVLRVTPYGSRGQLFAVAGTAPSQIPVLVTKDTQVQVLHADANQERGFHVTYEDVGGLKHALERVREMVELPLKRPDLFARLGVEAPKGVMIYGPPGCGKTLIARAVASETQAHFIHVNGPEIIHKFYGESEAKLREIFEEAQRHAPSIIFLDEIDAIAPRRSVVVGDVERRVVAQLLALMDGLVSRGEVVVIGATNVPEMVDPALRRPGRFDRELEIGVPDQRGRHSILGIHTRGMPLAPDVSLEKIARVTHGFVGADLEILCKEAAMHALRAVLRAENCTGGVSTNGIEAEPAQVTMADFRAAMKEVQPSARRELFAEKPAVNWSDVGGLDAIKATLRAAVQNPLRYPALSRHLRAPQPKGILLQGPPGCGKTLVASALAGETDVPFITVDRTHLVSKWLGESEKALREVFRKAKQSAPCLLFFDDLDALAPVRGSIGVDQAAERLVSQLLSELDGLDETMGVVVLAATNRPELVDPALLRPGRFDLRLEFPSPDVEARLAILGVHTRERPLAEDVDLASLARRTEGLAGSHLETVCRRAASMAMAEFLEEYGGEAEQLSERCRIAHRHFASAIDALGLRDIA
jgi:transitional endoplasmic reticulum ATPase